MALKTRRGIKSDLEGLFISPLTPIMKVVEVIDRSAAKIALVTEENKRLLGTITDGDIRRGILRGAKLTEEAQTIMNPSPRTAGPEEPRTDILERMKQKLIHQMPLLDNDGRVIGLEVLDELLRPKSRLNRVILMVGGLGTRLRPLTESCPKPLLNVGTKPILETILESFIQHGFRRFYMAVHYKNEMVRAYFGSGKKWGAEITYLHEKKPCGTAGALSLLPEKLNDPLFVMNGDLLTKVNFDQLLRFHVENKDAATACVREVDFRVPYGVIQMNGRHIVGINEKPVHRFFVNAGIYVLEPRLLKLIPKNRCLDMPNFFEKLIKKKNTVGAFPIREYWLDIGRLDDFERANGEFKAVFK